MIESGWCLAKPSSFSRSCFNYCQKNIIMVTIEECVRELCFLENYTSCSLMIDLMKCWVFQYLFSVFIQNISSIYISTIISEIIVDGILRFKTVRSLVQKNDNFPKSILKYAEVGFDYISYENLHMILNSMLNLSCNIWLGVISFSA